VLQAIRRALYGKEEEGGVSGAGGEGGVLWEWRQGHLLLELYAILADAAAAEPLLRRLLITLFQVHALVCEALSYSCMRPEATRV
jgi:hypothetical protein